MKRPAIIIASLVTLTVAAVFAFSSLQDQAGYQNTVYSSSYSTDAFARIAVGTPRSNVVAVLGAPLSTRIDPSYPADIFGDEVSHHYGGSSNIAVEFLYFSQPRDRQRDFHWVQICFGPDGTVVGTSSYITD